MAVCKNYITGEICPKFYVCEKEKEIAPKTNKKMQGNAFYCLHGIYVRKIAGKKEWNGKTPKWCPRGRTE